MNDTQIQYTFRQRYLGPNVTNVANAMIDVHENRDVYIAKCVQKMQNMHHIGINWDFVNSQPKAQLLRLFLTVYAEINAQILNLTDLELRHLDSKLRSILYYFWKNDLSKITNNEFMLFTGIPLPSVRWPILHFKFIIK